MEFHLELFSHQNKISKNRNIICHIKCEKFFHL